MKALFQKLVSLYRTNSKFHSLVVAVEYGLLTAIMTYSGGIPKTKDAWMAAVGFFIGAAVGAMKRWLVNNVPPPPDQTQK